MTKMQRIFGWLYLPIHMFVLAFGLSLINEAVLAPMDMMLDGPYLNLVYYAISFLVILILMFTYLRATFEDLCDHFWASVKAIILGYVMYYAIAFVCTYILILLNPAASNPNNETIIADAIQNANVMKVVTVLLAPIVEEVLFRGVVFGTIRKKSRLAAYIVSTLIFAFYHIWQYLLIGFDPKIFLYLLQYIGPSIALAWSYENSKNLWTPIFIHMLINFISVSITLA